MTPDERKAARELTEKVKAFEGEHPFAASPVTRSLEAALDQIDADDGLMQKAAGYLGSVASGEPLRYNPACKCDGCVGLRELRDALRVRLGEAPAPEPKP